MSKLFKTFLIVMVILLVAFISSKFWGPPLRDYLQKKISTWFKGSESSQSSQVIPPLTKPNYPKMVAVSMDDLNQSREVAKKIKEIGANTVLLVLVAPYGLVEVQNSSPQEIAAGARSMINEAYKNGLSAGILIDQIGEKPNSVADYDRVSVGYQEYVKEYAKLAHDNKLVYLQVAGEADGILRMSSAENRSNELIKSFLETAKANFSGEIGIGFDICMGATFTHCPIKSLPYDLSGYDFTSTSVYLNDKNIFDPAADYLETFQPITNMLRQANDKYNVKKIYSFVNAGSIWQTGTKDCEERNNLCYPLTNEQEIAFYQNLLTQAKKVSEGIIVPYFAINGRSGEKTIKEFFQSF